MHNLRVLQLGKYYPPHKGGMETHLQTLCDALRDSVDVRVIVANQGRRNVESFNPVPVSRVGTLFNVSSAPICPGMLREIRAAKADLVHIHVPNPSAVLAYLASGHKGPLVVTYQSDTVRQKFLGKMFEPILNALLDRAAAILVSTPNYLASSPVLARYRDRCHVVHLGISSEPFENPDLAAVARIRERYGSRIVLSVGRLVYYKGFDYLIRAMERVNGRLLIAGEGPLHSALQEMIGKAGLGDRVHLLGEVEDLVSLYHAAELFVLPSVARSEAFGLVQLEAMACGKPVINTYLDSGVPFVSQHGITGLTVPPKDAGALAAAITHLLDNDDLRARYGYAARQRLHSEFNLDGMVRRILALYGQVMRQPTQVDLAAAAAKDGYATPQSVSKQSLAGD